jgi:negative regulator of sigma E activity
MGSFSEQDSIDPDDPKLDYTPLRLSERAAKLGPSVSQAARSEPIRSSSMSRPASLVPKAINEPARRTRDLDRAALLSVAARVAAVAAVVAVVALLFVIMKPASRQSVASSTPSDITGSTSPPNQRDVESKPALAELKAPPGQLATDDQSQQLLQRFLQWREKANTTEPSQ